MQEFYRLWTTNHSISKAEALRQAQLELLHGQLTNSSNVKTAAVQADASAQAHVEAVSQRGVRTKNATASSGYTHPYYWAPFILFGNWQ
jgi:CHAT domain-containing protein